MFTPTTNLLYEKTVYIFLMGLSLKQFLNFIVTQVEGNDAWFRWQIIRLSHEEKPPDSFEPNRLSISRVFFREKELKNVE